MQSALTLLTLAVGVALALTVILIVTWSVRLLPVPCPVIRMFYTTVDSKGNGARKLVLLRVAPVSSYLSPVSSPTPLTP